MMNFDDALKAAEAVSGTGRPNFYRELWGMQAHDQAKKVQNAQEWQALPYVTKDALLRTSFSDRLFIEPSKVDHLRMSSGTSGKPPLFSARTLLTGMDYRLRFHDFKKPILAYWVPGIPHWHESFQKAHGAVPHVVQYDPKNPVASIRIAKAVGVDSISTFAFHIAAIGEHMMKERMADTIRLIEICGESCSRRLFDYIRTTFPNATIIPFYGSSEVEDSPIGVPCRAITGQEPFSIYHAKDSQYHELIDPLSGASLEPTAGAEGELIVTSYSAAFAFPLIRYRTGDVVRVVETRCTAHKNWSFTVLGRAELDFIKISGGVLRADEIERVLQSFKQYTSGRFELHRYERATDSGPQTQAELRLETLGTVDLGQLAQEISESLRVAPEYTYADGVRAGRYLPLACVSLATSQDAKKTHRLTDHRNSA